MLAKHLANADPVIRLAAAEEAWEQASRKPEAFASTQSALRVALDDGDAAVAMNAAGALAAMDVPETELAAARRRVLSGGVRGYVGFLAARGLVGIDPAPPLLPYLLDYYLDAVEAEARGGSDDNVELARPEAVMYEPMDDGSLALVAVEYITSKGPASLEGHLFNFNGAPNRYGLGPFYELHVWAWKSNPTGTFADMNPDVSCNAVDGEH